MCFSSSWVDLPVFCCSAVWIFSPPSPSVLASLQTCPLPPRLGARKPPLKDWIFSVASGAARSSVTTNRQQHQVRYQPIFSLIQLFNPVASLDEGSFICYFTLLAGSPSDLSLIANWSDFYPRRRMLWLRMFFFRIAKKKNKTEYCSCAAVWKIFPAMRSELCVFTVAVEPVLPTAW